MSLISRGILTDLSVFAVLFSCAILSFLCLSTLPILVILRFVGWKFGSRGVSDHRAGHNISLVLRQLKYVAGL